ncbi:MAG: hypothetical protein ACK55I_12225, partial [bacterium]
HHGGGERVDQETDLQADIANYRPFVERAVEGVAGQHIDQGPEGRPAGRRHAGDGGPVRGSATDGATEQARDDGARQRGKRSKQISQFHVSVHAGHPFRLPRSST